MSGPTAHHPHREWTSAAREAEAEFAARLAVELGVPHADAGIAEGEPAHRWDGPVAATGVLHNVALALAAGLPIDARPQTKRARLVAVARHPRHPILHWRLAK